MALQFVAAKYNAELLTVDYTAADGTHLLRTGGTIAWRFNNPGNLRPAKKEKPIYGAIGVGTTTSNGTFLIFSSYEEGRKQKKALLRRKYNERTIYTMLAGLKDKNGNITGGYSPASDNNDPEKYSELISRHVGVETTQTLKDLSDSQLDSMMAAMEKHEGFHGKKDTRKEKIVHTTSITISDGAQPRAGLPVKIAMGGMPQVTRTNERGQLPPIPHTDKFKSAELFLPLLNGDWCKVLDLDIGGGSKSLLFANSALAFFAPSDVKKSETESPPAARKPMRYVVQPRDTLGKLAKHFDTSVPSILRDNPNIKEAAKIYPGQVISLHGKARGTVAPPVKNMPPVPRATAASALPARTGAPAQAARSKEGLGAPLALIQPNAKRAPWMEKAIAEAKQWKGQAEDIITKSRNYHKLNGAGFLASLAGKDNAWCASFVNYCLANCATPYSKWKDSFRARAVALDTTNFVQIDTAIYGAIALVGTHHVAFVYAKSNGNIVCLGGNQSDQINFSSMGKKLRYFVPIAYHEFAKKDIALGNTLEETTPETLNKAFGIQVNKKGSNVLT